jgi:hypothetical protein
VTKLGLIISCIVLLTLSFSAPAVASEIYKCVDKDDNITYQQMPCPEEVEEAEVPETVIAEMADDEPAVDAATTPVANNMSTPSPAPRRGRNQSVDPVEQCKMPIRNMIDAIEAEMRQGYSPEQGELFKTELHGLTERLRSCES